MRRQGVPGTHATNAHIQRADHAALSDLHQSGARERDDRLLAHIVAAELLWSDGTFALQRVTTTEGERFLVKSAAERGESLLQNEYEVFAQLGSELTLRPLRREPDRERSSVVYQDFEGLPLAPSALLSEASPQALLTLVRGLIAPVRAFHAQGWLVQGLCPASFIVDPARSKLLLAAAPFARSQQATVALDTDAWTRSSFLPYAAPELIGRAPLAVDERADLYALGCVFYALLCGQAPFEGDDSAELIQAHLAKRPTPLAARAAHISPGLSRIVMRLLAKEPAQRPQSLAALEDELVQELTAADTGRRRARTAVRAGEQPRLSAKLYGLQPALRALNDKFNRTRDRAELVILDGDAGVGKSSLLSQSRKQLQHGYFCLGRFEHSGTVAPLSGWATALRELALLQLTRDSQELSQFRDKVQQALGDGADLVSALVPEWAVVVGSSTRDNEPVLAAGVDQLALSIHGLLRCYAEPDKPVVLALDDLHWADTSSLRILELILTQPEPANLLVLAAMRGENELADGVRRRLSQHVSDATVIPLVAWDAALLEEFFSDSFGEGLRKSDDLAALVLARTRGNPFFVHEFLKSLIQKGLLSCEPSTGEWSWVTSEVRSLLPGDSVVDLLTRKLRDVPPELERVLSTAACLGRSFALTNLASAAQLPLEAAHGQLEQGVAEGLFRCSDALGSGPDDYEFTHDRVLEACRSLMSRDEYAASCLTIARALRAVAGPDPVRSHQLAGYFNAAAALVTEPEERLACAELNLLAARLVKHSGAFSQALDFLLNGIAFLSRSGAEPSDLEACAEGGFRARPELAHMLYEEAAEAGLLNSRFELVYELCALLLMRLEKPLERVRTYEIKIGGLSGQKRFPEAVEAGREILRELGVVFPKRPRTHHAILAYMQTKRSLFRRPITGLYELPESSVPEVRAASRVMQSMYSAAYFSHPNLYPLLVCRHILDSLRYGVDDYSCVTYAGFALMLGAMRDVANARELAQVSLKLVERREASRHRAKVLMGVNGFVLPWTSHLRDTLSGYDQAIAFGLRYGDFEYANHLLTLQCLTKLHAGAALTGLKLELEQTREKLTALRQERGIVLTRLWCQVVHDLQTPRTSPASASAGRPLAGPSYDEQQMLSRCLEPLDHNLAFHHFMTKLMLCLWLGDPEGALAAARAGRPFYAQGAFGLFLSAVYVFWEGLVWASAARRLPSRRLQALRRVVSGCRQLARWAKSAPMNFAHKEHLLRAELFRSLGHRERAAIHYEQAIELALTHGYVHEAAMAQELAAEFYFERGMQRLGRTCLRDSHASYTRWGASEVARRLERSHPEHFALLVPELELSGGSARAGSDLDHHVLLRASQAISGEIELPKLLERLLQTMFQHAGAQRALLILERDGQLWVEAEADIDRGGIQLIQNEPLEGSSRLCRGVARVVARTRMPLVLGDASSDERFRTDPYVRRQRPKSLLCTPLLHQSRLLGVAYLENNRVSHVFTQTRLEVASLLAAQAAISLASAQVHALEIEAQQARINPHFLFNALSSMAELAIVDGARTEQAILQLSHLYRYTLMSSLQQRVSVRSELEVVRTYLELEKLRFGSKLAYEISCDEAVAAVEVPGLLIQPLVENAIRHGIAPKLSDGHVWIHASQVDQQCRIVVQDDGDGSGASTPGTGFGLRSVQQRCTLLYGTAYSMAITRRGGYRVELSFPLVRPQPQLPSMPTLPG